MYIHIYTPRPRNDSSTGVFTPPTAVSLVRVNPPRQHPSSISSHVSSLPPLLYLRFNGASLSDVNYIVNCYIHPEQCS